MKTSTILLAGLSLGLATVAFAQPDGTGPRPPGPGRHGPGGRHMPPPVIAVLDANHDGVISADEIANASTALLTLDKNADGKLTQEELRPPRPADAPPPPADAEKHHPANPVMLALDANGDGELSAAEIANAPTSLKSLDVNNDGKLTIDELRPLPPPGAPHDGPPPPQE